MKGKKTEIPSYVVRTGTPSHLAQLGVKRTYSDARTKAADVLRAMVPQAEKFDRQALAELQSLIDQVAGVPVIPRGEVRRWSLPYMGVTFVIEIERDKK